MRTEHYLLYVLGIAPTSRAEVYAQLMMSLGTQIACSDKSKAVIFGVILNLCICNRSFMSYFVFCC